MQEGLQPLANKIFRGLSPSYDRVLLFATLFQDRYWKGWVLKKAKVHDGATVLDIGCGTGVLEQSLPRCDARIVGVDLTEEMLREAQRKGLLSIAALSVGDGQRLPFRDASFDTVLSCYVVKYCDSRALVAEMHRVLKPGGRVVLYDFSVPRGVTAPFLSMYIYAGLRILSALLKPIDAGQSLTYGALPSIIRSRIWNAGFAEILTEAGFSGVSETRLTGGAVTAFEAIKVPSRLAPR
jgi:demethylmenaquinone methyltransferase / 2-methoxy-6-polyprenyl-1,4-benzoquinol methylase